MFLLCSLRAQVDFNMNININGHFSSFFFSDEKRCLRIYTRQRCRSTVNIFRAEVMLLVYQLAFCDTRSAIFAPVSSKQIVAGIIRERFWENGCGANISEPRVTRNTIVRKIAKLAQFSLDFTQIHDLRVFSHSSHYIHDARLLVFPILEIQKIYFLNNTSMKI